MTPIEQLAKEFSKGNPATEAAFLAGAKQARLRDIEIIKQRSQYETHPHMVRFEEGYEEALEDVVYYIEKELL